VNRDHLAALGSSGMDGIRQLVDALQLVLVSAPPPVPIPRKTIQEAGNEYLVGLARAGRSERHVCTVRNHLAKVFAGKMLRALSTITPDDLGLAIDVLQRESGWAPRTVILHVQSTKAFFSAMMRRHYCASNPAEGLEVPRTPRPSDVVLHTPAEVAAVLHTAQRSDLDAMRWFAIAYFAGLRSAELSRLQEYHIRERYIEVPSCIAKTRSRRLVSIGPALRAFLDFGGRLPLVSEQKRLKRVRLAAGVPWLRNVARHSFVSYHLANSGSAARTALEAGHAEPIMFRHYAELVTPEDAAAFWAIRPKSDLQTDGLESSPAPERIAA